MREREREEKAASSSRAAVLSSVDGWKGQGGEEKEKVNVLLRSSKGKLEQEGRVVMVAVV